MPGAGLDGRFTRAKLDAALAAVCARVGLDHRDTELIKFTDNAVFRLTCNPAVVRIAGSPALLPRVDKVSASPAGSPTTTCQPSGCFLASPSRSSPAATSPSVAVRAPGRPPTTADSPGS